MMIGLAAMLAAIAFTVMAGYLISTLIYIKKVVIESEHLLSHLNNELPSLLREVRHVTENVNAVTIEARDGIEHASVFLHAVGEMGEAVQHVHGLVRGGKVLTKLTGIVAGVKAASSVMKQRFLKGGNPNGAV